MTKQTKAFTSIFLSLFVCIQASNLSAQNNITYSKEVQTKIKKFENNLGLWVQIGNQQFTLADRMKSNHVNGVSIALIKDYKIEWQKDMVGQIVRNNGQLQQIHYSRQVQLVNH